MMVEAALHAPPPAPPLAADAAMRVRVAANPATAPSLLRQLADDPDVLVRAAVAMNPSAAPGVDHHLLSDGDERVRALLGRKLAGLMPGLSSAEQSLAYGRVQAALGDLAADAAVRVRAALADAVKSMPQAPRELILRLANDSAAPVSTPVVRLSPLLTDADLLALLATPPHPALPDAVAGRPGLSATVADVLARHAGSRTVSVLLANQSAAIQEATLDALVGRAAAEPDWHEPLVRRPALSARSARALSGMVAASLMDVLVRRADLDPALAVELRQRVVAGLQPAAAAAPTDDALVDAARRLDAAGALDEAALLDAAELGDHRRIAAIVSVASGIPLRTVDRAVSRRSAKGLVSLAWKAGFTMRSGVVMQSMLGQLGPGSLIQPSADGAFPLTADEMQWQIEVLTEAGR